MNIYYLQSEFALGKHKIVKVIYDSDVPKFDEAALSLYSILEISEAVNNNKPLRFDLIRTESQTDIVMEGKYYINSSSELMEKEGWTPHIEVL